MRTGSFDIPSFGVMLPQMDFDWTKFVELVTAIIGLVALFKKTHPSKKTCRHLEFLDPKMDDNSL